MPPIPTINRFLWKCLPFNWGIPIPVWLSFIAAVIGLLGVYMTLYSPNPKEKGKKLFYIISFVILAAMIGTMTWRQNYNDEYEKKQMFLSNSNQAAQSQSQIAGLRREMAEMRRNFSTNGNILPAVRLAILDDQESKVMEQVKETQAEGKLINMDVPSLNSLAADRDNKHKLRDEQITLNEIQQAKNLIKSQEQVAKDKVAQKLSEQQEQEKAAKEHKETIEKYVEIFDNSLITFNTALAGISSTTGEQLKSDFPNGLLTIHDSSFLDGGELILGSKRINLGTNSDWNFKVSTIQDSTVQNPKVWVTPLSISLKIESLGKNSSILVIKPIKQHYMPNELVVDGVSIKLQTKDEVLNIDETPTISNYYTNINVAFHSLLEAQDEQHHLMTQTNTP